VGVAALAALTALYAWFEAGWVRLRVRELPVPGLPAELDGLRIAHLSDLHLGVPSRGVRAVERAFAWVAERRPDLVCVTGDLLSRPRAEQQLLSLLAQLAHPYVVLGNHDHAISRDPFSRPVELGRLEHGTMLLDGAVTLEERRKSIEIAGVDPRTWLRKSGSSFGEPTADLRILLCHFPRVLDTVPAGRWHLILAGHLHAGQIVLPYGFGKVLLAHPGARYPEGVFERNGTVMHVSPGLGTTFLPFRFFARPEATELVLRCR
jgi:predicted MPP superfamily phosphohydrolase